MLHTDQGPKGSAIANSTNTTPLNSLYVAVGLQEQDVGYPIVVHATETFGERKPLTHSLWKVRTQLDVDIAFKEINTSMLDRRIDSHSSLLVFDSASGKAKWHVRQPLSDLISAYWNYQNNVFISFSLDQPSLNLKQLIQCITKAGIWAPLSKNLWYLSTNMPSKRLFQSLLDPLGIGDQLCVFDSRGQLAIWNDGARTPMAMALT